MKALLKQVSSSFSIDPFDSSTHSSRRSSSSHFGGQLLELKGNLHRTLSDSSYSIRSVMHIVSVPDDTTGYNSFYIEFSGKLKVDVVSSMEICPKKYSLVEESIEPMTITLRCIRRDKFLSIRFSDPQIYDAWLSRASYALAETICIESFKQLPSQRLSSVRIANCLQYCQLITSSEEPIIKRAQTLLEIRRTTSEIMCKVRTNPAEIARPVLEHIIQVANVDLMENTISLLNADPDIDFLRGMFDNLQEHDWKLTSSIEALCKDLGHYDELEEIQANEWGWGEEFPPDGTIACRKSGDMDVIAFAPPSVSRRARQAGESSGVAGAKRVVEVSASADAVAVEGEVEEGGRELRRGEVETESDLGTATGALLDDSFHSSDVGESEHEGSCGDISQRADMRTDDARASGSVASGAEEDDGGEMAMEEPRTAKNRRGGRGRGRAGGSRIHEAVACVVDTPRAASVHIEMSHSDRAGHVTVETMATPSSTRSGSWNRVLSLRMHETQTAEPSCTLDLATTSRCDDAFSTSSLSFGFSSGVKIPAAVDRAQGRRKFDADRLNNKVVSATVQEEVENEKENIPRQPNRLSSRCIGDPKTLFAYSKEGVERHPLSSPSPSPSPCLSAQFSQQKAAFRGVETERADRGEHAPVESRLETRAAVGSPCIGWSNKKGMIPLLCEQAREQSRQMNQLQESNSHMYEQPDCQADKDPTGWRGACGSEKGSKLRNELMSGVSRVGQFPELVFETLHVASMTFSSQGDSEASCRQAAINVRSSSFGANSSFSAPVPFPPTASVSACESVSSVDAVSEVIDPINMMVASSSYSSSTFKQMALRALLAFVLVLCVTFAGYAALPWRSDTTAGDGHGQVLGLGLARIYSLGSVKDSMLVQRMIGRGMSGELVSNDSNNNSNSDIDNDNKDNSDVHDRAAFDLSPHTAAVPSLATEQGKELPTASHRRVKATQQRTRTEEAATVAGTNSFKPTAPSGGNTDNSHDASADRAEIDAETRSSTSNDVEGKVDRRRAYGEGAQGRQHREGEKSQGSRKTGNGNDSVGNTRGKGRTVASKAVVSALQAVNALLLFPDKAVRAVGQWSHRCLVFMVSRLRRPIHRPRRPSTQG